MDRDRRTPHCVTQCQWIYWMCQRTLTFNTDESTECERQISSGVRLQHQCQREQGGRWSERTEARQARFDRQHIHGEESVVFSGSISVELDSEGSIVSTCTEHEKIRCYITHQLISDEIFLYQLTQARPHNVLHFLVIKRIGMSHQSDCSGK